MASLPSAAGDSLTERLLREAPDGWRKLRGYPTQMVGRARTESVNAIEGRVKKSVLDLVFKRNGDWILIETFGMQTGAAMVDGRNGSYGFRLTRPKPDAEWLLDAVGSDEQIMTHAMHYAGTGGPLLYMSWSSTVYRLPLEDLISDPSFRIKSIQEVVRGGRTLISVEFDCAVELAKLNPVRTLHGRSLLLDPAMHWAVRECDVDLGPGTHVVNTIEYDIRDGQVIPAKVTSKGHDDKLTNTTTFEFVELSFREVPEADFRLSAYGLKEPDSIINPPTRTRWWLWGTLAGFALLVLGAVFDWLRRRAKR